MAEDADTQRQEFNRAFVLMQYFGYLRRDPDAAPEPPSNTASASPRRKALGSFE